MKYVTIQLGPDYQLVFSEVVYWNFSLLNSIGDVPVAYEVSILDIVETTGNNISTIKPGQRVTEGLKIL